MFVSIIFHLQADKHKRDTSAESCTLWRVCLWLSLFFSSSFRVCTPAMRRSSSWKRWLVQSECCSIHEFWIIQEGETGAGEVEGGCGGSATKGGGRKDSSVHQKWTVVKDGRGKWHQAAASWDYLSDFHSHIIWAQLLGKAKTPRMQHCQLNLSAPVQGGGGEGRFEQR